jgi:hypothetical protein
MKLRHVAALVLVYWILFLDTSPDRRGFYEWAGNFTGKASCERALLREQAHPYNMNHNEVARLEKGIKPYLVHGLPGFCESSEQVLPSPSPAVTSLPD